jgi:hypothetical protein
MREYDSGNERKTDVYDEETGTWKPFATAPRYRPDSGGQSASSVRQDRRLGITYRREFDALPEVKDFNIIANQYQTIADLAARGGSAQDDVAAIFSFMKTLDPTSVVREGEFATAQNAAGIPERVRNAFNQASNGQRLSPEQRRQLASTVGSVYNSKRGRYKDLVNQYQGYVRDAELPDDTIVPRRDVTPPAPPAKPAIPAPPKPLSVVDGYRFKGGDPKDKNNWVKIN